MNKPEQLSLFEYDVVHEYQMSQRLDLKSPVLKPCPLCGKKAYMDYWPGGQAAVLCSDSDGCGCYVFLADSPEEAVKRWNRRIQYCGADMRKPE